MRLELLFLLFASCGGRITEPAPFFDPEAAYPCSDADPYTSLIVPSCATSGCHTPESLGGGLDLLTPGAIDRVWQAPSTLCFNRTLYTFDVSPIGGGYFIDKLIDEMPACGERMPKGRPPLTDAEMSCLQRWLFQQASAR